MNDHDLIELYFERGNAMQNYWNLYVVILGGVLAFSSLRKQPAPVTTALVCLLEPTLAPATRGSVKITHLTSDVLALAALIAMEIRRRRLTTVSERSR